MKPIRDLKRRSTDQGTSAVSDSVWVVVPTYNEIDNIEALLDRIWSAIPVAHVLIVDDGSPDGTADYVRSRKEFDERVHLLERSGKLGIGTAYVAGFKIAINAGAYLLSKWMAISATTRPRYRFS